MYYVTVKYRCESDLEMMLKFGKFTGKEYDEYIKQDKETEYMLREKGVEVVASMADEKAIYVHESPDENSNVTDTLYHRQQIYICSDDTAQWVKAYSMEYKYLGYIKASEYVSTEELSPLWFYTSKAYSEDGSDVLIYSSNDFEGDPVKKLKNGEEITACYDQESEANVVYEKQPDGSMKRIGFIKIDNIGGDEEEYEEVE